MEYDVIIIGGGPAGLTSAIYASRANLKTIFIEKGAPGGKMVKTQKIENWSGDKSVTGPELAMRMFEHSKEFQAEYKYGDVVEIKSNGDEKKEVILNTGDVIKGKSIIIATGTTEVVPTWIKNAVEMENKGVSYCAICDGPLYKDQKTAIIGGGNSAIEEGAYLSSVAKHVDIFVIKDGLIAEKKLIDDIKKKSNVTIHENSEITEIHGTNSVTGITTNINGKLKKFDVKAVFPYIGLKPSTEFIKTLGIENDKGFIKVNEEMETSVKGIFAIGDVTIKLIRQIATAVSDGAIVGKILANRLG